VGAVVADVVADEDVERHPAGVALGGLALDGGQGVDDLDHRGWLDDVVGPIGGAPHGDGELHLPRLDAVRAQLLGHLAEAMLVEAVHLGVGADHHARRPRRVERPHRRGVAADVAAQLVVHLGRAVDGDADAAHPRGGQRLGALGGQGATAGLHHHPDASAGQRAHDVAQVRAQVGLAADQRHLTAAQARQGRADLQHLGRGQLAHPRRPGARPAVLTRLVALHGQLPHRVDRLRRADIGGAQSPQRSLGRGDHRHQDSPGLRPRPCACPCPCAVTKGGEPAPGPALQGWQG
jgi:hypothetical protein